MLLLKMCLIKSVFPSAILNCAANFLAILSLSLLSDLDLVCLVCTSHAITVSVLCLLFGDHKEARNFFVHGQVEVSAKWGNTIKHA